MKRSHLIWMLTTATLCMVAPTTHTETPVRAELTGLGVDHFEINSITKPVGHGCLAFTENRGQWDERVKFKADVGTAIFWITDDGVCYQFARRIPMDCASPEGLPRKPHDRIENGPGSIEQLVIKATFVGSNRNVNCVGKRPMEYMCNYFIGNDPSKWHTDVPSYETVVAHEVYTGIDVIYYGDGHQLEYDLLVKPGADYSQIQLLYTGADSMYVTGDGALAIATEWGELREVMPAVYQNTEGSRRPVTARYKVLSNNTCGFVLGDDFDPGLAVTIDPVLVYSTYLGGYYSEESFDIEVVDGNAFVVGFTTSYDFPVQNPYQTDQMYTDAFITKLAADGSSLVYSTYLGGEKDDEAYGCALDADGALVVVGSTKSVNFPLSTYPYQSNQPGQDAFIARLSSAGNELVYSSYLGGSADDYASAVDLDQFGNEYVTGITESSDFPVINPIQTDQPMRDAFVTKRKKIGGGLDYSTYLGGNSSDDGRDIVVDADGNAYLCIHTGSSDFPTLNPFQTFQGDVDAAVVKLAPNGLEMEYSTYLGGSDWDFTTGITVDSDGNAHITGYTYSTDFPTLNPIQSDAPDSDAFVAKLNNSGDGLIYSTYVGGDYYDRSSSIALDKHGNVYITGFTGSSDFPTVDPFQEDQPDRDCFITKINSSGTAYLYSTYFGGSGYDQSASSITVDDQYNFYVLGQTESTDFPLLRPFQSSLSGSSTDAFVAKFHGYVQGDANGSAFVDIDDVSFLISYIFEGGPAPQPLESGDADCSGFVDIDDVVYVIAYIFEGGPPPGDTDDDGVPDC